MVEEVNEVEEVECALDETYGKREVYERECDKVALPDFPELVTGFEDLEDNADGIADKDVRAAAELETALDETNTEWEGTDERGVCTREWDTECDKEAMPVLAEVGTGFTELEEDSNQNAEEVRVAEGLKTALDETIEEWDEWEQVGTGFTELEEDSNETAEEVGVAEERETALDDAIEEWDECERECDKAALIEITEVGAGFEKLEGDTDNIGEEAKAVTELEAELDEVDDVWEVCKRECDSEREFGKVALPRIAEVGIGFAEVEEEIDETSEMVRVEEELDTTLDEEREREYDIGFEERENDTDEAAVAVKLWIR
ncbi:hypothetical protein HDU98_009747 [Podochytrium sp. JEL0797]|nr:hypothetical protein HDU98_009747 [Podochytrium sp. JEL0797]